MTTLTREQVEALYGSSVTASSTDNETVITADKFVGDLQGNADTATALKYDYTLSVTGDAYGTATLNHQSTTLNLTVQESAHAVHADTASSANSAANASLADLANIANYSQRSNLATHANNADEAVHAADADNALHAVDADEATHATSADSAAHSTTSSEATHATSADEATHATSADNATHATSADSATHATSADTATTADSATEATHATSADEATHATTADTATNATTAETATHAMSAVVAVSDGTGSNIANQFTELNSQVNGAITKNTEQDGRLTALENYTLIKEWDSSTTYALNRTVIRQNNLYTSLIASNINHDPLEEIDAETPVYWQILSKAASSGTADCVHLSGEENIVGVKNFTAGLTGNLTGDVTGNVTGNLTGSVTGNVSGDVTGNLTGNVTGDVTGDVTGNADTATRLGTATVGSATMPIYLNEGTATACNEMCDLSSTQTITGQKTFSSGSYVTMTSDKGLNEITNVAYVGLQISNLTKTIQNAIGDVVEDFGGVNLISIV